MNDGWDTFSDQWRADMAPAVDLAETIAVKQRRGTARLWVLAGLEVLVLLALVAFTVVSLRTEASGSEIMRLAGAWLVACAAIAFAIQNRSGVWRAPGESTLEFLALCEERARRKRLTARFVVVLVVVHTALQLGVTAWSAAGSDSLDRFVADVAVAMALAATYFGWAGWYRRRAQREVEEALALRDAIEASVPEAL